MKRLPIGIFVLVGLVILGFWTGRSAGKVHGSIVEALEQAARAENWSETAPAVSASRKWEESRMLSAAITDHSALDEIEAGFAQLDIYRRRNDLTHFTATCARLSRLVKALEEGHKLSWENIL